MKLGVFAVLFKGRPFTEALDYIAASGLDAVEIGCGRYPGKDFCDPAELLRRPEALREFRQAIRSRGLEISALSCHGNPLHPDADKAAADHQDFENAVRLAAALEVDTVVTFSGCPGESEQSRHPVWVTVPWPEENLEVLEWQWHERVIPYWSRQNEFLAAHGVRAALEAHPHFVVYNTETCLRLREACGPQIGINFDPSHLFWQGMDPVACIRTLGQADALFHVHAKDTAIDTHNTGQNGVLDTKPYAQENERSWIFRTVGYGHGEETWRRIISALRLAGYDGAISIEHEDSLMSTNEGFRKAVAFLQPILIREKAGEMYWA